MANSLVTIDMITREALRIAHEKSQFIGTTDLQYDENFAKTGAKIGSALRVRKPNMYTRTTGSRVMDVQDQTEANGTITLATQDHVDMRFNSAELALSIDEISKRYIEPAMATLISGIESDYLAFATKATYNWVGYQGTATIGTAPADLLSIGGARAKLNQGLAPKDGNRYVQMDSLTMGGMVNGLKGLFQDSQQIKEQYREGLIGRTGGADWYENDRMWSMTNGSDITGTGEASSTLGTAAADGGINTLNMSTTIAYTAQVVGQVFTVAGVYACHPETKALLPGKPLQCFTITTVPGSATFTTISPTIYLSGPRQNVCGSTGAALAATFFDSATLNFPGATSTAYVQNLMYHKEAFQFVTADLPLMASSEKCVRRVQDGLSLRVWQDSDIRNDELLMRIDILYGMAALRPEWACRISS